MLILKARRQIVKDQIKVILNAVKENRTMAAFEILQNLGIFNWQYYCRNTGGFERILSSSLFESDEFNLARERIRAYDEISKGYSDTEKRSNKFLEEMEIEMFKEGSNLAYLEYINLWLSVDWKPDGKAQIQIDNFELDFDQLVTDNPAMLSALRRSLVMIPTLSAISDMTINSGEELRQVIEEHLKK